MPEDQIIQETSVDIAPDTIPVDTWDDAVQGASDVVQVGAGFSTIGRPIQSTNYSQNKTGWKFNSNGEAEINGAVTVSTNFTLIFKAKGVSFFVSNGTTPNGNLYGNAGDVCFNGPSGQPFKCTTTTTWVGL